MSTSPTWPPGSRQACICHAEAELRGRTLLGDAPIVLSRFASPAHRSRAPYRCARRADRRMVSSCRGGHARRTSRGSRPPRGMDQRLRLLGSLGDAARGLLPVVNLLTFPSLAEGFDCRCWSDGRGPPVAARRESLPEVAGRWRSTSIRDVPTMTGATSSACSSTPAAQHSRPRPSPGGSVHLAEDTPGNPSPPHRLLKPAAASTPSTDLLRARAADQFLHLGRLAKPLEVLAQSSGLP